MCKLTQGQLIGVVGASGVGKDSVISGIVNSSPEIKLVRRTITRAPNLGGEDYDSVSQTEFDQRLAKGDFCLHWQAHKLSYGIPASVLTDVHDGKQCLANLSRGALTEAAVVFPKMLVLTITASAETITKRLSQRGRENDVEIVLRLARSTYPLPANINAHQIDNNGSLQQAVEQSLQVLNSLNSEHKADSLTETNL